MNTPSAMNNMMPHHRIGSKEKKPTYKKAKDGTIIDKTTGKAIGIYKSHESPNPGERSCKINGKLVAYLPMSETVVPG